MNRAYALLTVKAVDNDKRTITGIATTPEPDRMGDVVEPLGVEFKNPLPLLLFHDSKKPVGFANFKKPTADGIAFTASLPTIEEPGTLRDRVEEAWQSLKAGLIGGVSIGFRAIEEAFMKETGGIHFLRSEVVELSLVTIPANAQATILTVKSLDQAASGRSSTTPGVTGLPVVKASKDAPKMAQTINEQIGAFENKRAAHVARMNELTLKCDGSTFADPSPELEEYTTLDREVESIDAHLPRLRKLEKSNVAGAIPVSRVIDTKSADTVRSGAAVVTVKPNVEKGTAFTRFVMAKIVGKSSMADAIAYAESRKDWMDTTPEVVLALKAAVNPGTTTEPAWAAPLAIVRPMSDEFLELLRPATIIGKINGFRRVPFNVSMPVQTGGGTYTWVGETAPKPVGNLQLTSANLLVAKAAGIIVISEELARISTPSAEAVVRGDMVAGMAQYLDQQFIDPTVAAVAGVSPGSITNGAGQVGSAGTSGANAETDFKNLISALITANQGINNGVAGAVLIMSETYGLILSLARTTNGERMFPDLTANGGRIAGIQVITSQAAGTTVAVVIPGEILMADDGGVNIDVSREASVEMSTTPTSPTAAATVLVSLWQQNLIGLRAERFINWKRARAGAVRYTTATYV